MIDIEYLYYNKKYDVLFNIYKKYKDNIIFTDKQCLFFGLSLFELGLYKEASCLLLQRKKKNSFYFENYIADMYLGLYYYSIGNYDLSKKYFYISKDVISQSSDWCSFLFPKNKLKIIGKSFHFYFEKDFTKKDIDFFILKYEKAFDRINSFFKIRLKKKIDVFVYYGYKDEFDNNLSYSNSFLNTINVNHIDENGHEITHILSRNLPEFDYRKLFFFVDEGIAECFNEKIYSYKNINYYKLDTVFSMWEYYKDYDLNFVRLIAKIFITNLFNVGNREQFFKIIKNQSFENFKEVYGNVLNEIDDLIIYNSNSMRLIDLYKNLTLKSF